MTEGSRRGTAGDRVVTLQALLYRAGFPPGPVDGVFGPLTEGAVKAFQRKRGLVSTGVADEGLFHSLQETAEPSAPPVWAGKHMWIGQVDECEGGDSTKITARAAKAGLRGVLIKTHDGDEIQPGWVHLATPLKAAGLVVGAWGSASGRNVVGEATAALAALEAGADWYVIDAEAEFEGRQPQAREFCQRLRQGAPDAVLGYAPLPMVRYHQAYPYRVFSEYCDLCLPRVYWAAMDWPLRKAWTWTLDDLLPFGRPLVPIGQAHGAAVPGDLTEFGRLFLAAGSVGVSFWSWQHATPEQWEAVSAVAAANPGRPPGPAAAIEDLRRRGVLAGHPGPEQPVTWGELALLLQRLYR